MNTRISYHITFPVETRKDAHKLIDKDFGKLCTSAKALREAAFGNSVTLCAIINARNGNCSMNCSFCSQSSFNHSPITPYPLMDPATLHHHIDAMRNFPIRHCGIVTSGGVLEDTDVASLAEVIRSATAHPHKLPLICASLGRLKEKQLTALRNAGMVRLHHNLETSEAWYPHLCTTQKWRDRLDTVATAKKVGLEVCCGGLFGTGESWDDRIDFAFTLRNLHVQSIPINFLTPHQGTPFEGQPPMPAEEALRIIALFRHILPTSTLRICGGRTLVLGNRQAELFAAGANALMTGDYLTSSGQGVRDDLAMIDRLGLQVVA